MRVKTSELEGAALDWAVAKALGAKVIKKARLTNFGEDMELFDWFEAPVFWWADSFRPSIDWRQGGPLIERLRVSITERALSGWVADARAGEPLPGQTALIAAMRAIVAAELGDAVDVPEELCSE